MINPINMVKEKAIQSVETQTQIITNDLIDSTFKKITTHLKGRFGYEIILNETDKIKRTLKILKRLNPEKFKENSVMRYEGSGLIRGTQAGEGLRSYTNYTIKVPNAKAFINISYEYDDLRLYIFGIDSKPIYNLFQNSFKEKKPILKQQTQSKPSCRVYTITFDEDNEMYTRGGNRTQAKGFNNIYTDEASKTRLVNYIDKWKQSSDLFDSIGISHKLGILLYGEPGTGKTSISKTIASYLNTNLYTVSLNKLKPEYIPEFRRLADDHDNTVILLEDIDYVFGKREHEFTQEQRVAGQVLLQLLDGAESMPRTVFIATTNDMNSLDEAITRDGRFDLKINMGNIDESMAINMCKGFQLTEEQAHKILKDETFPINPAYLQNKAIQYIFSHIEEMNYSNEGYNPNDEISNECTFAFL